MRAPEPLCDFLQRIQPRTQLLHERNDRRAQLPCGAAQLIRPAAKRGKLGTERSRFAFKPGFFLFQAEYIRTKRFVFAAELLLRFPVLLAQARTLTIEFGIELRDIFANIAFVESEKRAAQILEFQF